MFNQIGVPGIILLLVLGLIVFGAKNLPAMGRSLGSAVKEFKEGVSSKEPKDQ